MLTLKKTQKASAVADAVGCFLSSLKGKISHAQPNPQQMAAQGAEEKPPFTQRIRALGKDVFNLLKMLEGFRNRDIEVRFIVYFPSRFTPFETSYHLQ